MEKKFKLAYALVVSIALIGAIVTHFGFRYGENVALVIAVIVIIVLGGTVLFIHSIGIFKNEGKE